MRSMEQDLGTQLEWIAVNHHNTGRPHTRIIVSGHDDRGQDLVMARHYICNGIRNRARELVSLQLGPESDLERWQKLYKAVDQERFTMIDRGIVSVAKDNVLALAANPEPDTRVTAFALAGCASCRAWVWPRRSKPACGQSIQAWKASCAAWVSAATRWPPCSGSCVRPGSSAGR